MTAGRPPKPTALKVVGGNAGKRAMNSGEPEPMLLNDLKPPKHLTPRSAAVWKEVAPMLRRIHLLTEADVISLEMLCDAVADYRFARQECGDKFVATSGKGSQMLSQWLVAALASSKRAESFMSRFGMDPVSRSKIMVDPQVDMFGGGAGKAGKKPTGTNRFFSE